MTIWTKDQMASIHTMLNPKSLAIVGATPRQQYGGRMLNAALRMKGRVNVYAVNPKYDEILGVKSYKNITELPETPDVVAVVVPYNHVLATLKEAHAKGTRAAIVISSVTDAPVTDDVNQLSELDRLVDDGNLDTGNLRLGFRDLPVFVLEH